MDQPLTNQIKRQQFVVQGNILNVVCTMHLCIRHLQSWWCASFAIKLSIYLCEKRTKTITGHLEIVAFLACFIGYQYQSKTKLIHRSRQNPASIAMQLINWSQKDLVSSTVCVHILHLVQGRVIVCHLFLSEVVCILVYLICNNNSRLLSVY